MPTESIMTGRISEYKDYNGKWVTYENLSEEIIYPCELSYQNDQFQYSTLYISQSYFNNDEVYEYIRPITKVIDYTIEEDENHDGTTDRITTYYDRHISGYKIMSDNGTTLQTIELPEEMDGYSSCALLELGDNKYLGVSGRIFQEDSDEPRYVTLYYHIPSDGSRLQLVRREESKVKAAQDGKNLIISFDGDCSYDNIELFDAAGRKALGRNIDSTAKEASVNISDLSQGTYILRATSQSGEKMSCKIAIR